MGQVVCRLCRQERSEIHFPRLRGVLYERCFPCLKKFPVEAIYVRDRGMCGICREHVPFSQASLDHIVPVSRWDWDSYPEGPHTQENVELAHVKCNLRKGSRLLPMERGEAASV